MSSSVCLLALALAVSLSCVSGHKWLWYNHGLQAVAEPPSIRVGFTNTPSLTVKCLYDGSYHPSYLSIGVETPAGVQKIAYLAKGGSVTRDPNNDLGPKDMVMGSLEGQEPYLAVTFDMPESKRAVKYVCHAQRMSWYHYYQQQWESVTVEINPTSIEEIVDKIKELQGEVDELQAATTYQQCRINAQASAIGTLAEATMIESAVFQGSKYYFNNFKAVSYANAGDTCSALGGYRARVDTEDEFNFIASWLSRDSPSGQYILLGTEYDLGNSRWINLNTDTVAFTRFVGGGEPNNLVAGGELCLAFLNTGTGVAMASIPCAGAGSEFLFLCEVPDSSNVFDFRGICPAP